VSIGAQFLVPFFMLFDVFCSHGLGDLLESLQKVLSGDRELLGFCLVLQRKSHLSRGKKKKESMDTLRNGLDFFWSESLDAFSHGIEAGISTYLQPKKNQSEFSQFEIKKTQFVFSHW
jgi:hypothetical protein